MNLWNYFLDLKITVSTELVLFLILTFGGSTIRNSWASLLAAATRTIRELILFKSQELVYIESIRYRVANGGQDLSEFLHVINIFNANRKFTSELLL